ncbi:MAG: hypothetical protein E6H02_09010 [Bacillati bacterium ANGP1]|uniref:Uncharacterized protein n=1 Tax=Candidatus Segetimicrobium genomatis TaxID=2569760 RepID=A0A537LNB7_9BACT|nr:MAG: hypothetical protein E6H02_09010 [Terrabacteria group bacterium ANGP1]
MRDIRARGPVQIPVRKARALTPKVLNGLDETPASAVSELDQRLERLQGGRIGVDQQANLPVLARAQARPLPRHPNPGDAHSRV